MQRALDAALEGRTSLVIAHRLSTVRNADRDPRARRGPDRAVRHPRRAARPGRPVRRPLPHPVRRGRHRRPCRAGPPRVGSMDLELRDRVYVVTGGARGLGRATAEVLVAEGARVVLSGRHSESLTPPSRRSARPPWAWSPTTPTPTRPARLLAAAQDTWGRFDGALVSVGGPPPGTVAETADRDVACVVRGGVPRRGAARPRPRGGPAPRRRAGLRAVLERAGAAGAARGLQRAASRAGDGRQDPRRRARPRRGPGQRPAAGTGRHRARGRARRLDRRPRGVARGRDRGHPAGALRRARGVRAGRGVPALTRRVVRQRGDGPRRRRACSAPSEAPPCTVAPPCCLRHSS